MTDYDIISKAYAKVSKQNALETDMTKVHPNPNNQETNVDSVNLAAELAGPKSKTRKERRKEKKKETRKRKQKKKQ